MARAAMAAAAMSTRRPPCTASPPLLILTASPLSPVLRPSPVVIFRNYSLAGSPDFPPSVVPPSSVCVGRLRDSTLKAPENPGESLRCRRSSCGSRWEYFDVLTGLAARGFAGFSSRKKCRAAAVMVGRQQQHYGGAVRDKVVDFGKFKGSMMGTLTSKYLKWMVNNLKSGPMSHWSEYAEEVLADPYYKDRLEWEKVEKLMIVAHDVGSITGNRDVVLAPARVFGWDLEDDVGWRKVNFSLIGTSLGGRIPRKTGFIPPVVLEEQKKKKAVARKKSVSVRPTRIVTNSPSPSSSASSAVDDSSSSGNLRDELMRRRAQRRGRLMSNRRLTGNTEAEEGQRVLPRFPGRESLLSTIRSYDISE